MRTDALPQYVATRRIGDATVTVISEGCSLVPHGVVHPRNVPETEWRAAMPEATADGMLLFRINVVHIALEGASILVDTGVEDPQSVWGREAASTYGITRTPGLVAGLRSIGVAPGDITHVLITHAHGDHFAGAVDERDGQAVPRYPTARYLLHHADWDTNSERDQPDSELARRLVPIAQRNLLVLVEDAVEAVPGVTMLHAPGETPGHSIVRVESQGRIFFALGDLLNHSCQVEHPDWTSPSRDRASMEESRLRVLEEAAETAATLVFAHAPFPPWGHIIRRRDQYCWEAN